MQPFVLASRNQKKIQEMNALFDGKWDVFSLDTIGFSDKIEETGITFEENAWIKAQAVAQRGYIGIADDSGLEVDALNGEPGIYSARYAGEACNDTNNNAKLLQKLDSVAEEKRTARFVCVIACVFPDGNGFTVRGTCEGKILRDYRGASGFGYDPLFYYEPLKKTFAELTPQEKNRISHRGQAMQKFLEKIKIKEKIEDKPLC